jgi:hypothetical protein
VAELPRLAEAVERALEVAPLQRPLGLGERHHRRVVGRHLVDRLGCALELRQRRLGGRRRRVASIISAVVVLAASAERVQLGQDGAQRERRELLRGG